MSKNENNKDRFISVGDLSVGFSENAIPYTDSLAKTKIKLYLENGNALELDFIDAEAVKYSEIRGDDKSSIICGYTATSLRGNICFIDMIVSYGYAKSVSIILDAARKIATILTGVLPNAQEMAIPILERAQKDMPLTGVKLKFEHAAVDTPFTKETEKHPVTDELIGKRIQFVYSANDTYEHIYLNKNFYTWHCITGSEEGLADTDRCFYYKIADNLYLFTWIEKIVPTLGIVIEDLDVMRSYGKIYGYEEFNMGKVTNFPVGSFATELNTTVYPK